VQPTKAPDKRRRPSPDRVIELGITERHSRRCAARSAQTCDCKPSYQGQIWSARDGKPIRKTFATIREARRWRQAAAVDLARRKITAPADKTLAVAAERRRSATASPRSTRRDFGDFLDSDPGRQRQPRAATTQIPEEPANGFDLRG
jgi:hypothetical protein